MPGSGSRPRVVTMTAAVRRVQEIRDAPVTSALPLQYLES